MQQAASIAEPLPVRLQSQANVQSILEQLQYRVDNGAPWYTRFGLNKNAKLLAAMWPYYEREALTLLRNPALAHLEDELQRVLDMPSNDPQKEQLLTAAYNQLKLYLMLSREGKIENKWLTSELMKDWAQREEISDELWQGLGPKLVNFYAQNLPRNPSWYLPADEDLIAQIRNLLIRQIGVRNSDTTLYQKVLAQAAHQYRDLYLHDMTAGTDASALFYTNEYVPGIYTRQAWEQSVQPAIEKLVKDRKEEMDWVLMDKPDISIGQETPEALKEKLTQRYFADFSRSWLNFLNSLQLQQASSLTDSIDQLTLMADVRQSPLIALMNTINTQARTGVKEKALADSLVDSTKDLFTRNSTKPLINQGIEDIGPMDATFRPVIGLMDAQAGDANNSNLSLQTFLTRLTQVRLRLQQASSGADPQAMTRALAQTVFQGRSIDLTDTRDYGSLVAASLGQEWGGFGQTVFVQPFEQSWQKVLQPAANSLNNQWKASIVDDWNSTFAGRYPFQDVSSEVSIPLLAQYLNGESGRISRFLQTELNGVLRKEGRRWVPDSINSQGLASNPEFLEAINTLSYLSDVVFPNGNANISFEMRPGTSPGIMETNLVVDNRKLTYANQKPTWHRFIWPADTEAPGANLSWVSTNSGLQQYNDLPSTWGLIRLLDQADIEPYPGLSSSFNVRWQTPDQQSLNYVLRTEIGEGPIALLKLRNFRLPAQIFLSEPAVNRKGR